MNCVQGNPLRISDRAIRLTKGLVFGAAMVGFAACSSDPPQEPEKPTRIEAALTAANDVNPNVLGQPSPVRVEVFELTSDAAFMRASFFALSGNAPEALGAELLVQDDKVLTPGQTVKIARDAKRESRYLAVVAAYQDLDRATWRAVYPLKKEENNRLLVHLGRLAVTITKDIQ